jgi:Mg-chelatase subunit ChlD
LRRRPKELDAEPALFTASSTAGGGLVLQGDRRPGGGRPPQDRGTSVGGTTDEQGELLAVPRDGKGPDPVVRATARRIAARLAVPRPRGRTAERRGSGQLTSLPYRGGSDDVDLDATLARMAENPVPEEEDVIVRERVLARRSIVLALDCSGSMRGERIRTAAAAVGALAGRLGEDDLAVLAFWSDAAWMRRLGPVRNPLALLDDLLNLPAQGLTNVAFPLQQAAIELTGRPPRDSRVLLLSDCVHNAGPDPRPFAARLPRLDVLLDCTGEVDEQLGADLARSGRGRMRRLRNHRDVAPALSAIFRT